MVVGVYVVGWDDGYGVGTKVGVVVGNNVGARQVIKKKFNI